MQGTPFEGIIRASHFEEPVAEPLNDCKKLDAEVQSDDPTRQTGHVASDRILQFAKKLSELKGKCGRLDANRNWFSKRYHWAVRYLRVTQDSSADSFMYLVIYSLWQSALLNKSFSKEMRQFLLGVVFCLIWEDCCLILSLRRSCRLTVGKKRTVNLCNVTLAPLGKTRCILIIILGRIHAIRFHSDALDWIMSNLTSKRIISSQSGKGTTITTNIK
jgi:hypothetical protein